MIPPALRPLVRALAADPYDKGKSRWSVTQLCAPAQLVILSERYADQIAEEEAKIENLQYRLYAMDGQADHYILERAAVEKASEVSERRLFTTIEGEVISGRLDTYYLEDELLVDLKRTTVWKHRGSPEWEMQLNFLAHLLREHGYTVTQLQTLARFRDWSWAASQHSHDYPEKRYAIIDVEPWPEALCAELMVARVRALQQAEMMPDSVLAPCHPEEMYEQPTEWALKKPANKRARKVCTHKNQARALVKPGEEIIERPGDRVRCTGGGEGHPYCPAAPWCHQLRRWKEGT